MGFPAFSGGDLDYEPMEFLEWLAALVPPPRAHGVDDRGLAGLWAYLDTLR